MFQKSFEGYKTSCAVLEGYYAGTSEDFLYIKSMLLFLVWYTKEGQ